MKIHLENIKVDTIIGINDWEKKEEQPLFIDVTLEYNSKKASKKDDIDHAVDYYKLTMDIIDFTKQSRFNLLETLAEQLLDLICENKAIEKATIAIQKPKALEGYAQYAAVMQKRKNKKK